MSEHVIYCFFVFPWEEFADFFTTFPPILTEDKMVMIMSGEDSYGAGDTQTAEETLVFRNCGSQPDSIISVRLLLDESECAFGDEASDGSRGRI